MQRGRIEREREREREREEKTGGCRWKEEERTNDRGEESGYGEEGGEKTEREKQSVHGCIGTSGMHRSGMGRGPVKRGRTLL